MEQTASEPISIRLSRDHFEEEIDVRPLDDGLFEILETPMLYGRVKLMDVVRLRSVGDGVFRVAEIIRRPFQHYCWAIPGQYGYSESICDFYRWLEARGGKWESAMGGLLFVHLPQGDDSADEVFAELNRRIKVFWKSDEGKRLRKAPPPGWSREQWQNLRRRERKEKILGWPLRILTKLRGRR